MASLAETLEHWAYQVGKEVRALSQWPAVH
ncbi:hypothetical protein HRbin30_02082 [bacterium HR30]|nr:hypothetical protein HRbin30_02082 [bacterium HR30]